jgi:hypothetical protein
MDESSEEIHMEEMQTWSMPVTRHGLTQGQYITIISTADPPWPTRKLIRIEPKRPSDPERWLAHPVYESRFVLLCRRVWWILRTPIGGPTFLVSPRIPTRREKTRIRDVSHTMITLEGPDHRTLTLS